MKKFVLVLSLSFLSAVSWAKRMAPVEIKPLVKRGNEFSFLIKDGQCNKGEACGMQVFLVSKNVTSGKINWQTELYQKLYDPKLEIDVQTIFPSSLKLNIKGLLIVLDEQGSKYIVKSGTGELADPLKSIIYPAHR